jgi:hypothetical protein
MSRKFYVAQVLVGRATQTGNSTAPSTGGAPAQQGSTTRTDHSRAWTL